MGWITSIANGIDKAFSTVRQPLQALPVLLLLCEVKNRPGLSAIALTAAMIKRLPEASIETGVNNCGSANKVLKVMRIIAEETIREIKDNARVDCAFDYGSVSLNGVGGNSGGPVVVNSMNITPASIFGIPQ